MAFHDVDAATSLLITQLALQDIEEYNQALTGIAGGSTTGETDEQYAFRVMEEDFELFLREQGLNRDRNRGGNAGAGGNHSSGTTASGSTGGRGGQQPSEPGPVRVTTSSASPLCRPLSRPASQSSGQAGPAGGRGGQRPRRLDVTRPMPGPSLFIPPLRTPSSIIYDSDSDDGTSSPLRPNALEPARSPRSFSPVSNTPSFSPSKPNVSATSPRSLSPIVTSITSSHVSSNGDRPSPALSRIRSWEPRPDVRHVASDDYVSDSDSDAPLTPSSRESTYEGIISSKGPDCVVCAEPTSTFHAPCGHYYCESCLSDFIKTSINDESSFPPQCCREPFLLGCEPTTSDASSSSRRSSASSSSSSTSTVSLILKDSDLVRRLMERYQEFSVPANDRLYCPTARCSAYIGSLTSLKRCFIGLSTSCPSCRTEICLKCKRINDHRGTECPPSPEELAERQVRDLAKEKQWQTCPGCKQMVEKTEGCHHMVCRCNAEFCYGCGAVWEGGTVCICGQGPAAEEHAEMVEHV
ncbi:hypothetical protein K435DRAFT_420391 [Dendrothele bispora CBS 962.96]|uniref:RBR-type E3 ubiquitin transferase n=1 Tax=Dendrothele bispora (strain CBS 962.96) TaxID=1314807 RepID=A0A4S8L5D5_DENBC|nr:hypothetical protein K435DRAFT_420391 [Dendrothele bispora CBS 962.96]